MTEIERANGGLYNVPTSSIENQRTPTSFLTLNMPLGSGTHTVWTPAAGKKFRLLGIDMYISGDVAAGSAGPVTFNVQDQGTVIYRSVILVPVSSATAPNDFKISWVPGGNGYLSLVAGNILQVNNNVALTAGSVQISAWGTEE